MIASLTLAPFVILGSAVKGHYRNGSWIAPHNRSATTVSTHNTFNAHDVMSNIKLPDSYSYDENGFDENGFDKDWNHKITGNRYDENGFNKDGTIHKDTRRPKDKHGHRREFYKKNKLG